jgi:inner membrane protein
MVDPLGLTIFLIGVALIVIELANPGYYIGVAGTTGVIVGLIQMAWPDLIFNNQWGPFIVTGIAIVSLAVSVEFYRRFAPAVKPPETLSSDALIGRTGRVVEPVEPNTLKGKVKVGGIVWSATSEAPIPAGADVVVAQVEGVHLVVRPAAIAPPPPPELNKEETQHG